MHRNEYATGFPGSVIPEPRFNLEMCYFNCRLCRALNQLADHVEGVRREQTEVGGVSRLALGGEATKSACCEDLRKPLSENNLFT